MILSFGRDHKHDFKLNQELIDGAATFQHLSLLKLDASYVHVFQAEHYDSFKLFVMWLSLHHQIFGKL